MAQKSQMESNHSSTTAPQPPPPPPRRRRRRRNKHKPSNIDDDAIARQLKIEEAEWADQYAQATIEFKQCDQELRWAEEDLGIYSANLQFALGAAVPCTIGIRDLIAQQSSIIFRVFGPWGSDDDRDEYNYNWHRIHPDWLVNKKLNCKWKLPTDAPMKKFHYHWDDEWLYRHIQRLKYY